MKKELSTKTIYDDFLNKTILTDIEKDVLIRYVKNYSIIKISDEINQSTSTVSRTISLLKDKYNNYKKIEIEKLKIFEDM